MPDMVTANLWCVAREAAKKALYESYFGKVLRFLHGCMQLEACHSTRFYPIYVSDICMIYV